MKLTDEQRMLRDAARDFAREWLAPYAAERDREEKFPAEAVAELGKLGFMGMAGGIWRGGRRPCRLCAGHGGDRRRRGCGQDDSQRAELGRLHAGLAIRVGRTEAAVSRADDKGRDARLLLPDRASGGLRRRGAQPVRGATATVGCGAAPRSSSPRASTRGSRSCSP
jgi:alkylation response protein AidB-like acyl-CoA dehydrogenase